MCDVRCVRTTLNIDEDVLQAAKERAVQRGTTAGKEISELARRGLRPRETSLEVRQGVPLLPPCGDVEPVTLEAVNRLRDES